MRCPRCTNTLTETQRQGVWLDQCPACGGIWLDRERLDHLLRQLEPKFLDEGTGSVASLTDRVRAQARAASGRRRSRLKRALATLVLPGRP